MKINKFKFKQILKLHLLKSRTYEQFVKKKNLDCLIDVHLNKTVANIKKALHIILKYNETGKRVLFIGIPQKLEVKINRLTNHVAVPNNFNVQGIFSTDLTLLKNSPKFLLPKLLSKPDLVVIISHEKKQNIISESYGVKIPIITLDQDSINTWYSSNSYNTQESITQTTNNNIFFIGLNFILKLKSKVSRK